MPLRDDLLEPIAGENPSGISMRYERVYDQIKDARQEDDDTLPAGAWERQAKRADYNLVFKLGAEVLLNKSKDLQVAAWLGEAYIKKEGASQIAPVLTFLLDLQKTFWDTIHPEIDEGDAGLRAVPLQWAANRYATLIYELPLTKAGFTYFSYKSGKALGYAQDAENNESRTKARTLAISRGQPTAEDIDEAIAGTQKSFYANLDPLLQAGRDVLEELSLYCEEQYLDDGPSFRKLRDSLDEVHNLVHSLLAEKLKADPDPVAVEAEPEPEPEAEPDPVPVELAASVAAPAPAAPAAPARAAATGAGTGGPPTSWDDAAARVHACAAYMHGERPGSSVPYLLHSSLRWGELRKGGPKPELSLLVAPPGDIRSGLKLAASEKNTSAVLSTAMRAMTEPCARCWLDLHRYLWNATTASGYAAFSTMILQSVAGILREYPDMPTWTFLDDTPVANAETLAWLAEEVASVAGGSAGPAAAAPVAAPVAPAFVPVPLAARPAADEAEGPDVFAEASQLAASGNLRAATALLTSDAATQTSGRMRAQRRIQIAELCLSAGNAPVALSILREVVSEMEQRRLETWETKEMVARPLALLLSCTAAESQTPEWAARFARLCELDASAALEIMPG